MSLARLFGLGLLLLSFPAAAIAAEPTPAELLAGAKRVLFLGDSITAAGQYVAYFDAWLTALRGAAAPAIIDGGLPSETVSGLSEEGHAGGQFPRPDLAERIDRLLPLVKPDLVFACYGINCGIYEPFDEERFAKYQAGYKQLKAKVEKAGAKLIIITPPFYDDQRAPRKFSYNEVLDRYSDWLVEQRKSGWTVIDLHGPMTREVRERRKSDPQFTFQPDGVHPNAAGQWFIAQQLIRVCGDDPRVLKAATPQEFLTVSDAYLPLVQQRVNLLRDSYVAAAGHKRPGVAAGLPETEAEEKAKELTAKIIALIDKKP